MNRKRLLERFLRYVKIDTTAVEDAGRYPSSQGQIQLGALIVEELHQMGINDAEQDDHGIVMATIPSSVDHEVPVIAFNAHFDTSPETTGANVNPQVLDAYQGGDISLSGEPTKIIRVSENPELNDLHGKTIITTDGTTLLGGDDKAGIAIMMELANTLLEDDSTAHGPIRLLFTCDEEIGRGVDYVDIKKLGAVAAYTFDGGGANDIDVETFSADLAVVTVKGINIHPSIAKNRMVNSIRAAGEFVSRLPRDQAPETTSDREGFLHPYVVEGSVAETQIRIILRHFDTPELENYANLLRKIGGEIESDFPGTQVEVETKKQYRNLGDGLATDPRVVAHAVTAHERLGRVPKKSIIRGGTDGSLLTEKGLPTPNLSSGQHNPHSPLEWACLDEMLAAAEVGREIVALWAEA